MKQYSDRNRSALKVVTINVCDDNLSKDETCISDIERDELNPYLKNGLIILDRFTRSTTIHNSVNVTYVLKKKTN